MGAWLVLLLFGEVAFAGQISGREEQVCEAVTRAIASLDEAESATRLTAALRVPQRTVRDLRDDKPDLGDVAVVLALAETGKASPDSIPTLWATGRLNGEEIASGLRVELRTLP